MGFNVFFITENYGQMWATDTPKTLMFCRNTRPFWNLRSNLSKLHSFQTKTINLRIRGQRVEKTPYQLYVGGKSSFHLYHVSLWNLLAFHLPQDSMALSLHWPCHNKELFPSLSLFFSPHTLTHVGGWIGHNFVQRRNLYSLSQRRNRVDWSNSHHYHTSKLVYNWVTEVSITIYWTLLQSLNWSLLSQFVYKVESLLPKLCIE